MLNKPNRVPGTKYYSPPPLNKCQADLLGQRWYSHISIPSDKLSRLFQNYASFTIISLDQHDI
jgi:hypothetical protein